MKTLSNILLYFLLVIFFGFGGYYLGAREREMLVIVKGEPIETIVVEAATNSSTLATGSDEPPQNEPTSTEPVIVTTTPVKPVTAPKKVVKPAVTQKPTITPKPAPVVTPAPEPVPEPTTHVS